MKLLFSSCWGGVEKVIGDMSAAYTVNRSDAIVFKHIKVYALSLHHNSDTCIVRTVTVDFEEGTTNIVRGETTLRKEEAMNIIISALMSE